MRLKALQHFLGVNQFLTKHRYKFSSPEENYKILVQLQFPQKYTKKLQAKNLSQKLILENYTNFRSFQKIEHKLKPQVKLEHKKEQPIKQQKIFSHRIFSEIQKIPWEYR